MRLRRRRLLNAVCLWTNEKKYRVNELLTRLIDRCDHLAGRGCVVGLRQALREHRAFEGDDRRAGVQRSANVRQNAE